MKILDFPELRQTYEYDCGAKSLQAVLAYYGIEIREEILIKMAKTKPKEGTSIENICKTLEKFHLQFDSRSMTIEEIKHYIDQKIPVIILLQAWSNRICSYINNYHNGHWVVAIGYNQRKIFFEDPYSFHRTFLYQTELAERWHGREGREKISHYGIAVFGPPKKYCSRDIVHMV